jgi:hypothetical protein
MLNELEDKEVVAELGALLATSDIYATWCIIFFAGQKTSRVHRIRFLV